MKNRLKKIVSITKRALIIAALSFSLATNALADPKKAQMNQGIINTSIGVVALALGIAFTALCSTGAPGTQVDCILGIGGIGAGTGLLMTGITNFSAAATMDGGGEDGGFAPAAAGLGGSQMFEDGATLKDFSPQNSDSDPKIAALKRAAEAKLREAEEKFNAAQQKLIAQGIDPQDALAHPEKYLTPEQLAQYEAGKAEIAEKMAEAEANFDPDTAMDQLLAGYDGSSNYGGYGESIGTQGGVFAPNGVGMDDFLKKLQFGMKHSAPGYYGNVKLETLKPKSKQSLFERVSSKIKTMMKEAS